MTPRKEQRSTAFVCIQTAVLLFFAAAVDATPANKAGLEKHYDSFLSRELARCTTCHLPSENKNPESLEEFPHNRFGDRLRQAGQELGAAGRKRDIGSRMEVIGREDSDGDGVDNETELLLGTKPGDANDIPEKKILTNAKKRHAEFVRFLKSYRWQPFEPVKRPAVPDQAGNAIDAFITREHRDRGLYPRPEASKEVLLRRVYLDLIGLSPTPDELTAFENDHSADAYEKVVDRLLDDPRHGERWGRHWMDVWRYSDWAGWSGGNQIRDSKPHIWKWRDWIVESLNADKPYSRMVEEMLAGDEIAPRDTNVLRATGYLVRNYKMLSREQWLEDTVKHTSQAFLGLTIGCAKCHDHMTDPVSQEEYYQMRAIFEPHWARTDFVPGETNLMNAGLVRIFDTDTNALTYFLNRGDERKADTNRIMEPGVPKFLGGTFRIEPVSLPWLAGNPAKENFVYDATLEAAEKAVKGARAALVKAETNAPAKVEELRFALAAAEARRDAVSHVLRAEQLEDAGQKESEQWRVSATNAAAAQRAVELAEARLKAHETARALADAEKKMAAAREKANGGTNELQQVSAKTKESKELENAMKAAQEARKKAEDAEKALATAEKKTHAEAGTEFVRRRTESFPTNSTGRRLAFAHWLVNTNNPLTARVAVNHMWMRHFGKGLVATPNDFGRSGKAPSHAQLLDWLASEFMSPAAADQRHRAEPWSMKHMHRLMVTSRTYRMASTPDERNARMDPDNAYLWRMNSRRMEAEVVRDNLLYVSGDLDLTRSGPDIDHLEGLKSKRRSLYLRQAAEKEVEFLRIFDGPSVTECYARRPTVVPQQALALANSELTVNQARSLARKLESAGDGASFARRAFERILARHPKAEEIRLCEEFLQSSAASSSAARAREHLVSVLLNHNEFITIR